MHRRILLLALVVAVVIVGWSAFWVYAANEVETRLAATLDTARERGVDIDCAQRTVSGFPFRMEVRCPSLDVRLANGAHLATGAIRAVALIYDPRHVIVEADAPFTGSGGAIPVASTARWHLAHASLAIDLGNRTLSALDVSIEGLEASVNGRFATQHIDAGVAELHLRRKPDTLADAQAAVTFKGLSLEGPLQSNGPFDLASLLAIPLGADILAGRVSPARLLDQPVTVQEAFVARNDARLSGSGTLKLDPSGYLAGTLEVTATEPNEAGRLLAPFYPPQSTIPAAFEGALNGLGKRSTVAGKPVVSATLNLAGGGIRIGLIPIAQMLPLF